MALFGLFGGKKNNNEEAQPSGAFFLEPDQAKTMGDIEYMRTPNKVEHTFPGNKSNGGSFKVVKEVTATEVKDSDRPTPAAPSPSIPTSGTSSSSSFNAAEKRRSGDSNMDMFRQMAKNIKK